MEQNKKKIGFFKKVMYSIKDFEKYPMMSEGGVMSAIGYLCKMMLILAILLAIVGVYPFITTINIFKGYFQDGILKVNNINNKVSIESTETIIEKTPIGLIIFDINGEDTEKIKQYEETLGIGEIEIKFLNDKIELYNNSQLLKEYYYNIIVDKYMVPNFTNEDIVNYLSTPVLYISCFAVIAIELFIMYLIITLLDALMLSIFGVLTCFIAKIKMKYEYVFSMSIYSLTISIILQIIYSIINMATGFEIKYFDIMYTSISYICLAAAIFMIKSDIVRQYIEMLKIREEKKRKEEQVEDKNGDENSKEEKEQKEEKKDNDEKKNEEAPDINGEGSKA